MPSALGGRVRELRQKRRLTLEALAERVGSSKSYMWEIENKEVARPSAEKLRQIAVALGTTTDYLIAADDVTEADADDEAFFRDYRKMDQKDKARLREMLKILDDTDK